MTKNNEPQSAYGINVVSAFVPPVLDKINMIEFVDSRFEQYSNNGIEDMEVYIVNCLTQPEPDFWTTIQRYSSMHEEVTEKYKMRTDHWLFWYDTYFPNLAGVRNENTDLIQKSARAMLEGGKLSNEDFLLLYAQYQVLLEELL